MASARELFLRHLAQTSPAPLMLQIERAEGLFLFDPDGKSYADLIAGVSVSALGHNHPSIVEAVCLQSRRHMHLMVYGELVQQVQVEYARFLCQNLPENLNSVYFVNSGAEAVEGALKLARKFTGRPNVFSFRNAYHGSTLGALSLFGGDTLKTGYRPLIPGVKNLEWNSFPDLQKIDRNTACVVVEPIQAEAGIRLPSKDFHKALAHTCRKNGVLLVYDEIQTGFGRTGSLFAFNESGVVPDILVLAKSLGGGMPLGAFIADRSLMLSLSADPALGHITTFGGHPVSCAAGKAMLEVILNEDLCTSIPRKEAQFRKELIHPLIREIRGKGLMLAVELGDSQKVLKLVQAGLRYGFLTDWFLFCDSAFRISPPLNITPNEIKEICGTILAALDEVQEKK